MLTTPYHQLDMIVTGC